MYQMSHSYSVAAREPVPHSLETITNSNSYSLNTQQGNIAYVQTSPIFNDYHSSFSPQISSTTPLMIYNSNQQEAKPYQQTQQYLSFTPQPEYHFQPDLFLKPGKTTKFVGRAEEVKPFVEETFQKIFNTSFPDDIKLSILDHQQFQTLTPSTSTIGLSINRRQHGLLSEIFIRNDSLGRVMLTIGHELGHVLTPTLSNSHNEEAKAFAFSIMWMNIIKEHNIANLGNAIITENPAINGLHDVAFNFVLKQMKEKDVEEVYEELIKLIV